MSATSAAGTPAIPPEQRPSELDVRRPFSRADAVAAGITPKQLRGASYRRLFTGVYITAQVPPRPWHRVAAALLLHPPSAFASHTSAARLYSAPLPAGLADEHVSVLRHADRRRRAGIRHHVVASGVPLWRSRGLRMSSPARNFVELASMLSLVDLVVVGDHYVRKGWVTPEELVAHAQSHGSPAAVRAAGYVRRDVDSPMETRLRMLVVLAGLPEPVVNFVVHRADGRVRYRFDLSWPEVKVAVEYDGRQHRADLDQWDHDVRRDEWLRRAGWLRVPVFSRGLFQRPDETLERVADVLRERGCRGVPRRLADEWRAHFPVISG